MLPTRVVSHREVPPTGAVATGWAASSFAIISGHLFDHETADMLELNPVRQRITDLTDRVLSLRGYL